VTGRERLEEERRQALRETEALLAAARASEERFRGVFQGVIDGILLATEDGAFVMANDAMCTMLGCSEQELLTLGVSEIHPREALPAVQEAFRRQLAGELTLAPDIPVLRRDGSVFYADVNSTPVTIDGREMLMGCFRDVTERRRLQASLAQSERLASMGMLAAGVAHELNNPLVYVLYNLESLAGDLPPIADAVRRCHAALEERIGQAALRELLGREFTPAIFEELLELAEAAVEGARRIKEITTGLATFSRVEQDELSEVKIGHAVECAVNMAHNELKYRARLVQDLGEVPPVVASEGQISQVFLNLLINAAQAIDEGDVQGNEIRVRTWVEGDHACAEVSDTGRGIPREEMDRIFEPFFSTKGVGEGSGLGLAICRDIVTGLGGKIDVTSEVGRGSRFTVRLPVRAEARAARAVAVSRAEGPAVHGRVLIVEDDEAVRAALGRMLGSHEVVSVASGEDGQSLLREDQAFDVIICDMMMPRMSGVDLHEWLAGQNPALAERVIFITGGAFTPRARAYLNRVENPTIKKPFDTPALKAMVSEMVAAHRQRRNGGFI
jgi:PAS domain S-box-containing protein